MIIDLKGRIPFLNADSNTVYVETTDGTKKFSFKEQKEYSSCSRIRFEYDFINGPYKRWAIKMKNEQIEDLELDHISVYLSASQAWKTTRGDVDDLKAFLNTRLYHSYFANEGPSIVCGNLEVAQIVESALTEVLHKDWPFSKCIYNARDTMDDSNWVWIGSLNFGVLGFAPNSGNSRINGTDYSVVCLSHEDVEIDEGVVCYDLMSLVVQTNHASGALFKLEPPSENRPS